MAGWSDMSAGSRGAVVAGAAAVIAALFYGAWTVRSVPPALEAAVAVGTGSAQTGEVPEAAPADGSAAEGSVAEGSVDEGSVAEGSAAEEVAADEPVAGEPAVIASPEFDLVRVEQDGSALVAGRAAAGASVSLRINGAEIVATPADGAGKFVAMFNLAPSEEPRMLGMAMILADGTEVASEQTVLIAPTLAPVVVAEAGAETGAETGADAGADAGAEGEVAAVEPVAPAALLVTDEGAKVLQAAGTLPEMALNVTVDSISYSAAGEVQLAGRGMAGAVVRVYLDNAQAGDGTVGEAGDWSLTLPGIAAGLYTLRVDQLDETGAVTSRFETPFQRETLEALAAAAGGQAAGDVAEAPATEATATETTATETTAVDAAAAETAGSETAGAETAGSETGAAPEAAPVSITVQPGFTLWAIARDTLGDGVRYVQVFEANKAQIRDPNLIYPGQVFSIPAP